MVHPFLLIPNSFLSSLYLPGLLRSLSKTINPWLFLWSQAIRSKYKMKKRHKYMYVWGGAFEMEFQYILPKKKQKK
jgi:hypothetical protein